jgi:hypothetical protein
VNDVGIPNKQAIKHSPRSVLQRPVEGKENSDISAPKPKQNSRQPDKESNKQKTAVVYLGSFLVFVKSVKP